MRLWFRSAGGDAVHGFHVLLLGGVAIQLLSNPFPRLPVLRLHVIVRFRHVGNATDGGDLVTRVQNALVGLARGGRRVPISDELARLPEPFLKVSVCLLRHLGWRGCCRKGKSRATLITWEVAKWCPNATSRVTFFYVDPQRGIHVEFKPASAFAPTPASALAPAPVPIDPVVNRAAMQQLDKPEVEVESCVNSNDTTTTSSVICFPDFFAVYAVQVGKDEKEVVFPPATPRFACCKKLRVDSRLT